MKPAAEPWRIALSKLVEAWKGRFLSKVNGMVTEKINMPLNSIKKRLFGGFFI